MNKSLKSIKFPDLEDTYTIPKEASDIGAIASPSSPSTGDVLVYDGSEWTAENLVDNTLATAGKAADAKVVGDALATKTNTDGVYKDLYAGNLLSDDMATDTEPYLFRPSASGKSDREYDEIVGGTVCWNQLLKAENTFPTTINGITYTKNEDGSLTANGTSTGRSNCVVNTNEYIDLLQGHKYYMYCGIRGTSDTSYTAVVEYNNTSFVEARYSMYDIIIEPPADANHASLEFVGANVAGLEINNLTIYPTFIDLTAMFGSTIADYIYSLEQSTAGAGVAWFKKLFPKPYYEYNAGELLSVSDLQSHKMVGFNAWDEEWEVGSINNQDGTNVSIGTNRIRSKGYIKVVPNANYNLFNGTNVIDVWVHFYDDNKNWISMNQSGTLTNKCIQFTTPANCQYIRFRTGDNYGATYNHDICINLAWDGSRDGEYEPYVTHEYQLDDSLTLRGIPKLDANNKLYYDGDIYSADGTVTRRYGIVDLGTLNWRYDSPETRFRAALNDISTSTANLICPLYQYSLNPIGAHNVDKCICPYNYGGTPTIFVTNFAYTDAETFKAAMSGVYLVYELAEPTTEQADPYTNPQIVYPGGTEEYVSTGIVPVGHNTKYPENLRAKIEGLPWDLSMIAPIENGAIASQAYSAGQYFLKDDKFCKALTSIASGATFTLNTNYSVTTVAAELYAAVNA